MIHGGYEYVAVVSTLISERKTGCFLTEYLKIILMPSVEAMYKLIKMGL